MIWPEPRYNKDGQVVGPLNTAVNMEYLLDAVGISLRYNIVSKSVEVGVPHHSGTIDNEDNVKASYIRDSCHRHKFPVTEAEKYTKLIADRKAYNPIKDWIDAQVWDNVDRITDLVKTVRSTKPIIANMLIRKWLVMCIESMYTDSFVGHGCLVFKGPQGIGKTSWVKLLLPAHLSKRYIRVGLDLDPSNKDSVVKAVSCWIAELGELGSTLKRDLDNLKAFITKETDNLRRPYDALETAYPRRTVFYASVDKDHFLADDVNRRWWVVDCVSIDYMHKIDIGQLWAQVKSIYTSGSQGHLAPAELEILNESNEDYKTIDPTEERLLHGLQWDSEPIYWRDACATDIAKEIGIKEPRQSDTNKISAVLKTKGIERRKTKKGRMYRVPLALTSPLSVSSESCEDLAFDAF